ncbi:MAG: hypothetical protein M3O87_05795 [Candidatus Dormibacteraeota bacterium]|nr:hypothetical protein [Candidatus Dormibacteraeota bacterium]
MPLGVRYRHWLMARQGVTFATRAVRRRLGVDGTVYVWHRTDEYRRFWEEASRMIGGTFTELAPGLWEVGRNGRHTRIHISMLQFNDQVVASISANKAFAYQVAQANGVPVPEHRLFSLDELSRARESLVRNPGVYVVKPADNTSAGIGVTTFVRTPSQLSKAAILASLFNPEFIVERMVAGESCRLLFIDGELAHGVRRRGIRLTGDGHSPIGQLAASQGAELDAIATWTLTAQGLDAGTVPGDGVEVLARVLPPETSRVRELRTVYDEDITGLVSPSLVDEVRPVMEHLETRLAGVDVVTTDPSRPLAESGGVMLEVNPQPGIHHHYITEQDHRTHPIAVRLLEKLLAG